MLNTIIPTLFDKTKIRVLFKCKYPLQSIIAFYGI